MCEDVAVIDVFAVVEAVNFIGESANSAISLFSVGVSQSEMRLIGKECDLDAPLGAKIDVL